MTRLIPAIAALALATPVGAHEVKPELSPAIIALLEAAMNTGDREKVRTVVILARETNPDHVDQINGIWRDFNIAHRERQRRKAADQRDEIMQAGLFDLWEGKGQLGAFQSSGNNDSVGVSAAVDLERKGIDWKHKLRGSVDYRRNNGRTNREKFQLTYEPNFQISKSLFAYGLAQYERDRIQGFASRYSLSGGLGYTIIDTEKMDLSVKAGPALRHTDLVVGDSDTRLAALIGLDFDWQLLDNIKLTQDVNAVAETGGEALVFISSNNTTIDLVTGLEAGISNDLKARLSWTLEYDSDPPRGAVKTDTLSRVTLIYDF